MGDMGLQGAFGNDALYQLLHQRRMEAMQAQQQQFQNSLALRGADRADQQLAETTADRKAREAETARLHDQQAQNEQLSTGMKLSDQIPAGFLPSSNPAVGFLRSVGAGQDTPATLPMGPGFQGPMPNDETPQQAQVGRPAGFLKSASEKQLKDQATEREKADTLAREVARDAETERYHQGMLNRPPSTNATNSRLDRSYQYHRTALDKLAGPLEQQQQKIGELSAMIDQGTPQADALVVPKLLRVMAGGQGSGLRMNEAEIARVVGGRSNWESLKAAAQKWSTDPAAANSITPDQRQQIRALVAAVADKGRQALAITNDAGNALIDAQDETGHRRVLADTNRRLQQLYAGQGAPATPALGGGEYVYARDPQGGLHRAKKGTALPAGWKLE